VTTKSCEQTGANGRMSDEFQQVRDVLFGRRDVPTDLNLLSESCHRRLLDAVNDAAKVDAGDWAVLLRHALGREQSRHRGAAPSLPARRTWSLPEPDKWSDYGLTARIDGEFSLVQAVAWEPEWLGMNSGQSPERPLLAEPYRRNYGNPAIADPFFEDVLRHQSYRCGAQRQAVHAVLTAPAQSTLLVALPTGAGKSLCAQLPAILQPEKLCLVVVPTVTLALDQERAAANVSLRGLLKTGQISHATAYAGGTDEDRRRTNSEIRTRIRRGQQRIVFTSPEALLEPVMAEAVYTAARNGQLDYLVIDEAHIVDQWGDDFRSAFQDLAGLRNDLLAVHPQLRTILLSATVTEGCLETLETLFGSPGPFGTITAVQLRPEPEYWIAQCDESNRTLRVLEAIRHLPRPLILYVNRRKDAKDWLDLLQKEFLRCDIVTGETDTVQRSEVIRKWQHHKLDLVVATSAFGLGMDKDDIRVVLHACVPETIDRYYQEVGRGGRDGRASVSMVLYTQEDVKAAERLNKKTIIGSTLGFQRWREMYERKEQVGERWRVPVDHVPSYRYGETDEDNRYNQAWNVRTLMLLARAKVIKLDAESPQPFVVEEDLDEEERERRFVQWRSAYKCRRLIRVLDERHSDMVFWRTRIERFRGKTELQTERGIQLMKEALAGQRCLGEVLKQAYTIDSRVQVAVCCAGCPAKRDEVIDNVLPEPPPAWPWKPEWFDVDLALRQVLEEATRVVLLDDHPSALVGRPGRDRDRRQRLFKWLLNQGLRNLVADEVTLDKLRPLIRQVPGAIVFFHERKVAVTTPALPTLVLQSDSRISPILAEEFRGLPEDGPPVVLWMPYDAPDPQRPDRLLRDVLRCPAFGLDEFCVKVGLS
jgi:ATP-dependent DNA helicase RecQ